MDDEPEMKRLPEWFWHRSPLTMDASMGPDEQYRAGARDMLTVVENHREAAEALASAVEQATAPGRTRTHALHSLPAALRRFRETTR